MSVSARNVGRKMVDLKLMAMTSLPWSPSRTPKVASCQQDLVLAPSRHIQAHVCVISATALSLEL